MAEADPKLSNPADTKSINVHEAKTHFSKLLKRAHDGEEIVLSKAGKPYAKLVPFVSPEQPTKRTFGRYAHIIPPIPDSVWFDPLPEEELRLWEGR